MFVVPSACKVDISLGLLMYLVVNLDVVMSGNWSVLGQSDVIIVNVEWMHA